MSEAEGRAESPGAEPASAGTTMRLDGLSVARGGRTVVREVSLEIPPGEVTALLGPNGAGKSSLVLAVAGVLRPTAGRVLLSGAFAKKTSANGVVSVQERDLARRRPEQIRAAGVAIVAEGRRLLPELTIEENLRVATYSLSREESSSGIKYALELFPELEKRWEVKTRSLSGGEQQMVVLAQALVSRPTTLLVDELSLGLAPVVVKRLVPTLGEVASAGVGVLLIEQFAHVALSLANTAYVLEAGRIRYHGSAAELRDNPELLQSAYLLREIAG
jgi:branched-chain amino acid transport system ATP-binding protein